VCSPSLRSSVASERQPTLSEIRKLLLPYEKQIEANTKKCFKRFLVY
jgi:hypothetical protein